ncbi:hypothetical protein R3P38DRAFT_3304241 [Favolaschia claudopus]|uniref:HD domain-containing protein n=1 Tax=Favolaschia claudopus TaxID=2862362 RepID=A0AAW0E532_9AGAR
MAFPSSFDAYVPSAGPDLLAIANFTPTYVPFETLRAVPIDPVAEAASYAFAKKTSTQSVFFHVIRCFYFALALLSTGFPSGTPGVPQIAFDELSLRLYYTTLLHDIGWSNSTQILNHPAHAMSFELHGAFVAFEHLQTTSPNLDAVQLADIVHGIVLHTSQWPSGNSSANQMLMFLSASFDVGGYNGTNLIGADTTKLWHPKTVAEIEKAYPRGDLAEAGIAAFNREFTEKPNCLVSHYPGGEQALEQDFHVGPIVGPENQQRRSNVRGRYPN